jgi:hypothetical protein
MEGTVTIDLKSFNNLIRSANKLIDIENLLNIELGGVEITAEQAVEIIDRLTRIVFDI